MLYDFEICAVKDLDVSFVESDKDESVVTKGVEHFELARHLLSDFKFVTTEEVKLHLLILTQDCINANILDKLRGGVQHKLIQWQPVIIKVCMFFPDRRDYIINQVIDKVL